MVGTSNQSDPEMAVDFLVFPIVPCNNSHKKKTSRSGVSCASSSTTKSSMLPSTMKSMFAPQVSLKHVREVCWKILGIPSSIAPKGAMGNKS